MLTKFGKTVRKLRIDKGVTLKQMADTLNRTSAYLSAVETGRKNLPDPLVDEVAKYFELSEEDYKALRLDAEISRTSVSIPLDGISEPQREVAAVFARKFPTLSPEQLNQIRGLLEQNQD